MSKALKADGFDSAVIGWAMNPSNRKDVIVYDKDKIIEILMERDNMTHEEAMDYFGFNILGSYVGEGTPIFLQKEDLTEIEEWIYE